MNEGLRDILPFFRPRSAELTPFTLSVLILLCTGIVALFALHFYRLLRRRREAQERFDLQGRESGLEPDHIRTLRAVARKSGMKNPLQLLQSVHVFDRYLGEHTDSVAAHDPGDPVLEQVGRIRTLLGFDQVPPELPLRTTRQVEPGLTLMAWAQPSGPDSHSPWLVVSRDERGIAVVPMLKEDSKVLDGLEPGEYLNARFWRPGDTEYRFRSRVLDIDPKSASVTIGHARRLERLQNRDFFRLEVHFTMSLLALPEGDETVARAGAELAAVEEVLARAEEAAEARAAPATEGEGRASQAGEATTGDREAGADAAREAGAPPQDAGAPTAAAREEGETIDLDGLPRIDAEVVNLSGGGLSVVVHEPVPLASRLMVAPDFRGPFPLAGVICQLVRTIEEPDGTNLQLRFAELPPTREREIVRRIDQHQTLAMGGVEPGHTPERSEDEGEPENV